jgi:protein gp37
MTVLASNISWCTGTLNLTRGCSKISDGCAHCYAEHLVNNRLRADFDQMAFFPHRLADIRKFRPTRTESGTLEPKMIFVNSLSDFWHQDIPDAFIHQCLDAFETHPDIIFQILTKRPVRMRRIMADRYGNSGIPQQIWLGVSIEDNQVAGRMNLLRRLKDQAGDFCAFVSVEPLIGPVDEVDFTGADWILTGGESGPGARPMEFHWLAQAHAAATLARAALHFKQYGHPSNNPYVRALKVNHPQRSAAFLLQEAARLGLELAPKEKGGATYEGRIIHEKPRAWHDLAARLNPQASLIAGAA